MHSLLALLGLAALACATVKPSFTSDPELGLVITVPRGQKVTITTVDPDTGAVEGTSTVVTEERLAQFLQGEVLDLMNALLAGDNERGGPIATEDFVQNKVDTAKTVITEQVANTYAPLSAVLSDDDVRGLVDGMVVDADTELYAAFESKVSAEDQAECVCMSEGELDELLEDVSLLSSNDQAMAACLADNKLYNPQTKECVDAIVADCGNTIAGLDSNAEADCSAATHFGAECQAQCKTGFVAGSGTGLFHCSAAHRWVGDLECEPAPCNLNNNPPAQIGNGHVAAGECKGTLAGGDTCRLACDQDFVPQGDMRVTCTPQGPSEATGTCMHEYSCLGRPDGVYQMRPLRADSPLMSVRCSSEYMIMDYNRDNNWASTYFYNSIEYHGAGKVYGASKSDLIVGRYDRYVDWFKFPITDEANQMALSPDCTSCSGAKGKQYAASGNFISGCVYYNRNCDQQGDTCFSCPNNYQNTMSAGTCNHFVRGPRDAYPWETAYPCRHWWNWFSVVSTQGKFCNCFKPAL